MAIPKRLHFIWWQGFEHLPPHFERMVNTWRQVHPHWEITFWDRAKVDALAESLPKPTSELLRKFMAAYAYDIQRIDFARLVILHTLGGVCCDVDLLCLRSIETLLAGQTFYVCREQEPFISFCNAFLAATPQHPVIGAMLQTLIGNQYRQSDLSNGKDLMVLQTTGPRVLTPLLVHLQAQGQTGVRIDMDPASIYPVAWTLEPIPQDPDLLRATYPRSYAVHMWAGSWRNF